MTEHEIGTDGPATPESMALQDLPMTISAMNALAMDTSQSPANRKRCLTIAENCEKLLASLRSAQRKRLRAELTPAKSGS